MKKYYTPPVPSTGLAKQALEADALRVRQASQLISIGFFFFFFYRLLGRRPYRAALALPL